MMVTLNARKYVLEAGYNVGGTSFAIPLPRRVPQIDINVQTEVITRDESGRPGKEANGSTNSVETDLASKDKGHYILGV